MKTIMTLVLFMFMSSAVFAGTKFTPEAFEAAQKKGESIISIFMLPGALPVACRNKVLKN